MRKLSYLIREARQNTNTTDVEAITDFLCVSLLNRAQEFIQAFLFTQNIESKIFRKVYTLTLISGTDTYALPFDIYARNSINNVLYKNNDIYSPMRQIAEKARGSTTGYFLSDSTIIFCPIPRNAFDVSISYTKRLPPVGISYGTVSSVTLNTKITLSGGYTLMTGIDDFFCIVDVNGTIIRNGLVVSQTGANLALTDTSSITAGMFVVPGSYVTTICQLPDELEAALIMSLETSINARMSTKDIKISKPFSDEMLAIIGAMFSENTTDTFTPPAVEYAEWL
jgi:hypothetical protein